MVGFKCLAKVSLFCVIQGTRASQRTQIPFWVVRHDLSRRKALLSILSHTKPGPFRVSVIYADGNNAFDNQTPQNISVSAPQSSWEWIGLTAEVSNVSGLLWNRDQAALFSNLINRVSKADILRIWVAFKSLKHTTTHLFQT